MRFSRFAATFGLVFTATWLTASNADAQAAPPTPPAESGPAHSASLSASQAGNDGIANAYRAACASGGSVTIEETYTGSDTIPGSCAAIGVKNPVQSVPFVLDKRQGAGAVTGRFLVTSFGARGIGTDDETAAVQAAITTACSVSKQYPHVGTTIYFPPGTYSVHGLVQTCANVVLEGASSGATFLEYDGPQTSGPYPQTPSPTAVIITYTHGVSFGGLSHIGFYGFPLHQPVNGVATDILLVQGEVDASSIWDDVNFNTAIHDAVHLLAANDATSYINWFMHRIRFDAIGRYGIHADAMRTIDGNPLAIYGFTWTNPISHPPATKWLYDNGYLAKPWETSKTPWGEGVIGFTGGIGYIAALYDGRLEGPEPQIPVGPGREGNLFVSEQPEQPLVALHFSGSSLTSVTVPNGGFGWTHPRVIGTRFSNCKVAPKVAWTVSQSRVTGGTVLSGGDCSSGATARLYPQTANLFIAQNIAGFQSELYPVPLIYSASGQDIYDIRNVAIYKSMGNYMNGQTGELLSPGYGAGWDHYVTTSNFGWTDNGHTILEAPDAKLPATRQALRAGDIVYHDASDYASKPWGQIGAYRVVTYPVHGTTFSNYPSNLCSGKLMPSGNVWTGCTPTDLRKARVSVDSAFTFPTGGPSNTTLDTYVTAIDWSTGTITTAAPGASASQVNFTAPQYRDSWSTAGSYPVSPSTIYFKGEVVYNSAPASGKPIWWACGAATCIAGAGWVAGPAYGTASTAASTASPASPPVAADPPATGQSGNQGGQVFSGYCTGRFPNGAATVSLLGLGADEGECASSTTIASTGLLIPMAGSISRLFVRCATSGSGAGSGNWTVWVNRAPTPLGVTYGLTSPGTVVSDTTHTVKVAPGDLVYLKAASHSGETLGGCNASIVFAP